MWWNFPTELVEQVLSLLSIDDYVALCQSSSKVRQILDNDKTFQVVLSANFQKELDEYDWNFMAPVTKKSLWANIGKVRQFLRSTDKVFPKYRFGEDNNMWEFIRGRDSVIVEAINVLSSEPEFFLPLISELKRASCEFQQHAASSLHHPRTFSISEVAWLSKLLQLQNFLHAVKFFKDADLKSRASIEKCYFELSRCYNDFQYLARYRVEKLRCVRQHLQAHFPHVASGIRFKDCKEFIIFISELIRQILLKLDLRSPTSGLGGNILRAYKGVGRESQQVYLSILASIIEKEIFNKHSVFIGGKKLSSSEIYVMPMFLRLGPVYVSIDFASGTWNCYEEHDLRRIPALVTEVATCPIVIGEVLKQVFDASESENHPVSDLLHNDWDNLHFNTSIMKLRYLRTILASVCERKNFSVSNYRSLVKHSDFFLYFYSALRLLKGKSIAIPSFSGPLDFMQDEVIADDEFLPGDLVINHSSDYFGVVLGHLRNSSTEENFLYTLPFDNTEKSVALPSSVTPIYSESFGPSFCSFLTWLMSTDGMAYTGMFLYPRIDVSGKTLRLLPYQNEDATI